MVDLFYSVDGTIMGGVLPRRKALRAMGLAALAAGSAGLLAACGGNAAVSTNSGSASGSVSATTSSAAASAPATSSAGSSASSSESLASSAATSAATSSESLASSASTSGSAAAASVSSSASATTSASASSASASGATTSASASQVAAVASSGQFNAGWPYQVPPTGHWNAFVTNHIDIGIYNDLVNPPFAKYYWDANTWQNLLAADFKLEPPDKFTVTLKSGLKWSDGKDLTPTDVVTTFNVGRLMSFPVWSYLDKVSADGQTITFHMSKPASVVQRYVLEQNIYSDATFGDWAKKADTLLGAGKTSADADVKTLLTDFQKFRPDSLISSGPFIYDKNQLTEAQLTLVRNPSGYADKVQFAKLVVYNGETPTITPLVLAKQIDYATHGFPPATIQAFQQLGIRIVRPPTFGGAAFFINYAKFKQFAKPEVRQVLAYLIDRAQVGKVALGDSATPVKYMAGVSDNILPKWVDQADIAKLNQYPMDPAKATSMLQSIGWKKGSDGVWVDDTGAKWDYDLLVPSDYADSSAAAQNSAEQLSKFGLKTVVRGVEHVQANQAVLKGQFNLAVQGWGAGSPYPQFSFQSDILAYVPPQDVLGPGISFDLSQDTKSAGKVNFTDLVNAAGQGLDESAQKAAVAKMALAYNEVLPTLPFYERYGNNPILEGMRVTGWPPDSDPIYKNSPYSDSFVISMMYSGRIKPVAK